DNVLVSEDVRDLTLADFSTASVASAGESLTMTGTQEWSAPEVLDWENTPDEKNDIWGAGLCLNFMLAGDLPRR
ncbi:CIPK29, partial [Symbiodinium microadriaticum]